MLIVDKGSIYCKFVYFISGSITRKMYYTNLISYFWEMPAAIHSNIWYTIQILISKEVELENPINHYSNWLISSIAHMK